jgi:hypothetical protein
MQFKQETGVRWREGLVEPKTGRHVKYGNHWHKGMVASNTST